MGPCSGELHLRRAAPPRDTEHSTRRRRVHRGVDRHPDLRGQRRGCGRASDPCTEARDDRPEQAVQPGERSQAEGRPGKVCDQHRHRDHDDDADHLTLAAADGQGAVRTCLVDAQQREAEAEPAEAGTGDALLDGERALLCQVRRPGQERSDSHESWCEPRPHPTLSAADHGATIRAPHPMSGGPDIGPHDTPWPSIRAPTTTATPRASSATAPAPASPGATPASVHRAPARVARDSGPNQNATNPTATSVATTARPTHSAFPASTPASSPGGGSASTTRPSSSSHQARPPESTTTLAATAADGSTPTAARSRNHGQVTLARSTSTPRRPRRARRALTASTSSPTLRTRTARATPMARAVPGRASATATKGAAATRTVPRRLAGSGSTQMRFWPGSYCGHSPSSVSPSSSAQSSSVASAALGGDDTGISRVRPVSYTHLRAHETRHDLVC